MFLKEACNCTCKCRSLYIFYDRICRISYHVESVLLVVILLLKNVESSDLQYSHKWPSTNYLRPKGGGVRSSFTSAFLFLSSQSKF